MHTRSFCCVVALAMLALFSGCTSMVKVAPYPSAAAWDSSVKALGKVTATSGRWPLSLRTPPSDYTYYAAIKKTASSQFGVAEDEIVIGEVDVQIGAELDGTIRDWKATAEVGQKKGGAGAIKSGADRLIELKKLLDSGAITPAEHEAKKKEILEKF